MPTIINKDVVIIGAGLTGLSTAHYLKKAGLSVAIIEKSSLIGGVMQTVHEGGFIFESGPNTGVLSNPEVAELFNDLETHCTLETANPEAKKRLILKSGKWEELPSGLMAAIKTPLFTFGDKLRILVEPFRHKGQDPFESIADLVKRRLGKSYLNYAVDPFISGIYAGDPSKLVTKYALPKLYMLEQNYGSFIKGGIKKSFEPKDPRLKMATREVFSAKGGFGALTSALGKSVGHENIYLNAQHTQVNHSDNQYITTVTQEGLEVEYCSKYLVTTVDSTHLAKLLPFITTSQLANITNLEYASVVQVALGFNEWKGCDINAFGGLVPTVEKRQILGVLFPSSFFNHRAPQNGALLSVFLGGMKRPDIFRLSDSEIQELVFKELQELMQLPEVKPDVIRIFRYQRAIPQYGKSTKERLEAITAIECQHQKLYIAGGLRDGIGMADRVKQAKSIADEIIALTR